MQGPSLRAADAAHVLYRSGMPHKPKIDFSGGQAAEDALVRYVVREVELGRTLAEVFEDPYVTNRATATDRMRLMERREVIDAVGEDVLESLRTQLADLDDD